MSSNKKRKRDEELQPPLRPTCPICMQEYTNRTFLRPCYHSFCFICIRQWINIAPHCPLCKQGIQRLVYNVNDETKSYQEYLLSDKEKHDPPPEPAPLTAEERFLARRTSVYQARPSVISYPESHPRLGTISCIAPEHIPRITPFIHSELLAILGNLHDSFIETHIKHILLIPFYAQKRHKSKGQDVMDDPEIIGQLAEWLGDDKAIAKRFVQELMAFLRSGLNYRSYTSSVIYDVEQSPERQ